jgi:hypothetical protein
MRWAQQQPKKAVKVAGEVATTAAGKVAATAAEDGAVTAARDDGRRWGCDGSSGQRLDNGGRSGGRD